MSVTDEALAKIREMIGSGEFKPGDRLPKEGDLARAWRSPATRCARRSARSP